MTVPSRDEILAMNAAELHAVLADCVTQLQQGTMTPSQSNATTRVVGERLAQIGAAMRAAKLTGRIGDR